jgi:hypothetical protein
MHGGHDRDTHNVDDDDADDDDDDDDDGEDDRDEHQGAHRESRLVAARVVTNLVTAFLERCKSFEDQHFESSPKFCRAAPLTGGP